LRYVEVSNFISVRLQNTIAFPWIEFANNVISVVCLSSRMIRLTVGLGNSSVYVVW